jgi:hypothetical protein
MFFESEDNMHMCRFVSKVRGLEYKDFDDLVEARGETGGTLVMEGDYGGANLIDMSGQIGQLH